MCSIAGYTFLSEPHPEAMDFIEALLLRSQMRGCHATGVAYTPTYTTDEEPRPALDDEPPLEVFKAPVPAEQFVTLPDWGMIKEQVPRSMVLHTRYDTSGDWHTNSNNQPLAFLNGLALVHNGLVSMGTKAEFEAKYKVRCVTENDSEIILRKIIDHCSLTDIPFADAIGNAMREINGVEQAIYACGLLTGNGDLFCWADGVRPLYRFRVPAWHMVGFCSTEDIYQRTALKFAGVPVTAEPCKPGVVYHLNAPSNANGYRVQAVAQI